MPGTSSLAVVPIQNALSLGVLILGLGSCSNAVRVAKLKDRIERLEHENSLLETRVSELEHRMADGKENDQ